MMPRMAKKGDKKDGKEIGEMLAYIVEHMATKEDIAEVRREMATKGELAELRKEMATKSDLAELRMEMNEGFAELRAEIADIRKVLEVLESKVRDHAKFTKEIDYAFQRIAAIEEHLGIKPASAR